MTQPGVIAGRLTSPEGEPVANFRVSAGGWAFTGGERQLQIQGTNGTSDDTGAFRISGLAPGQYFVYAERQPVLAQGSGQIAGTVADTKGRPVTGASVTLWPVSPDLSRANTRYSRSRMCLSLEWNFTPAFSVLSLVRPSKSGLTHPAALLPRLDS